MHAVGNNKQKYVDIKSMWTSINLFEYYCNEYLFIFNVVYLVVDYAFACYIHDVLSLQCIYLLYESYISTSN